MLRDRSSPGIPEECCAYIYPPFACRASTTSFQAFHLLWELETGDPRHVDSGEVWEETLVYQETARGGLSDVLGFY